MRRRHHRKKNRAVSLWLLFAALVVIALLIDVALVTGQLGGGDWITPGAQSTTTPKSTPKPTATPKSTPTATPNVALPAKVLLDVPFQLQAPFSKWDPLHEDACEEASLLMVRHFLSKKPIESKQSADDDIIAVIHYEEEKGYGISISLKELQTIAKDYYHLNNGRIETDVTVNDIKRELAAGRPVILPAAGKLLANPYFRDGGPVYHMMVVKGYDETGFITNDPGIGKGKDYHYTYDILYTALHDWDPNNILDGQKAYLVFD